MTDRPDYHCAFLTSIKRNYQRRPDGVSVNEGVTVHMFALGDLGKFTDDEIVEIAAAVLQDEQVKLPTDVGIVALTIDSENACHVDFMPWHIAAEKGLDLPWK